MTLETKFKIELNMGDLPCLFWDSSTLKSWTNKADPISLNENLHSS